MDFYINLRLLNSQKSDRLIKKQQGRDRDLRILS